MFIRSILLIALLLPNAAAQDPPTMNKGLVGYVNPKDDFKTRIETLVAYGCKTIHITGTEYAIPDPVILETDELEIYGHGALLTRNFSDVSNGSMMVDICGKLRISGFVFDVKRPAQWKSYVPMINFHVNSGLARRESYSGPLAKYIEEFIFEGNKIIDSNGKTKANSLSDSNDMRDQWVIVSNLQLGGNSLIVKGNRLDVPDMELMGGTWGWDNVLVDGNHIWGGRTTGGYIGLLSRYYGKRKRVFRTVVITNNVVHNLHNNFISLGYDAKTLANTDFDMVRVEGNVGYLSPDSLDSAKLFLFKSRDFKGDMIIRGNTIDGSRVPFDSSIKPRDVWATNFEWGPDGEHTTKPSGTGRILYEPSRVIYPPDSQWKVVAVIKRDNFAEVAGR